MATLLAINRKSRTATGFSTTKLMISLPPSDSSYSSPSTSCPSR
jgi:hypothetical protein